MNCKEIELIIDEYAAGELSPERAEAVAAHLQACGACREVEAQYKAALGAMGEAAREAPRADVTFYRVLARRLDEVDHYAGRQATRPIRWHFVGSVAAAAAAVLILAVYVIPNMYGPAARTDGAPESVAIMDPQGEEAHATPTQLWVVPVGTDRTRPVSSDSAYSGEALPQFVFPRYATRINIPQHSADAVTRDDFRRLEERFRAVEARLTALERGH